MRRTTDEDGEPVPLSPRWLVAGMGLQVAYTWAYDRDIGDIRTKRLRSVIIAVLWGIVSLRVFPRSESVSRNLSIGGSFGEVAYRLWYGVLRPLPGDDD
ncbi:MULTISPECIES: hypothetical protein [Halorussus]|uniref:hypothetical protein n=1 Tax=Halorussus TaxID=1070314 RepID=UPI0020A1E976|nr:hypothetical protein [Halorussus vallis]USZ77828.1 hypothetical protein NGM07_21850 [Halorussus vallis]